MHFESACDATMYQSIHQETLVCLLKHFLTVYEWLKSMYYVVCSSHQLVTKCSSSTSPVLLRQTLNGATSLSARRACIEQDWNTAVIVLLDKFSAGA